MTNKEIKIALITLGKRQTDLIPGLQKRGVNAAPCEISRAFGTEYSPQKFQKIRAYSEEIIHEWEKEQEVNR